MILIVIYLSAENSKFIAISRFKTKQGILNYRAAFRTNKSLAEEKKQHCKI